MPFVYTPREHHNVQSPEAYLAVHAAAIARKRQRGSRVEVHLAPAIKTARIDGNTWLIDCECRAGNATDPAWGMACCFACGAVHEFIEFPALEDVPLIEAVVVADADPYRRFWRGETLVALVAQVSARGLVIPDHVIEAIAKAPLKKVSGGAGDTPANAGAGELVDGAAV